MEPEENGAKNAVSWKYGFLRPKEYNSYAFPTMSARLQGNAQNDVIYVQNVLQHRKTYIFNVCAVLLFLILEI